MAQQNMPGVSQALAEEYRDMAEMNFAMDYYNLYECCTDYMYKLTPAFRKPLDTVIKCAKALYEEEASKESLINELDDVRNELIKRTEVLVAYTDYFQIHEYLLNRQELRFEENLPELDNDEEARRILQFVFDSEDNMEINLRIKDMIHCLPVRMTTNRFFDLLKDSISVYKGQEKSGLDNFVYNVKAAAGITNPNPNECDKDLEAYKKKFDEIDYASLTEASYKEYEELMSQVGDLLNERTEFVMEIISLINSLYTYYLVNSFCEKPFAYHDDLKEVIEEVSERFIHEKENVDDFSMLAPELVEKSFGMIEGKPERLSERIAAHEANFDAEVDALKEVNSELATALLYSEALMSTSNFVKLGGAEDTTKCDSDVVDAALDGLLTELKKAFENVSKATRRAMMASVLRELPVFFISHTEVMNYVRYSLDNCKDLAEKTAAIRLFWSQNE